MLSSLIQITKQAATEWSEDNATRLAAAVAFYTILSVAPLMVLTVAVAGFLFGDEAARGELVGQLRTLMGDAGAEVVETTLANAREPESGLFATLIGLATLLFGASGVFGELQSAMNTIWDVKPKEGRGVIGIVKDRILSFGMVLGVGFLLIVSLVVSTALAAFGKFLGILFPDVSLLMDSANLVVSFGVLSVLFAMIYRMLPDVKLAWRDVWLGAIITALLFTAGKYLIGLYLGRAGIGTPFGAAGSLVAFVVWIYYSVLIFFFGAEITQVRAKVLGRWVEPEDHAVKVPPGTASVSH